MIARDRPEVARQEDLNPNGTSESVYESQLTALVVTVSSVFKNNVRSGCSSVEVLANDANFRKWHKTKEY